MTPDVMLAIDLGTSGPKVALITSRGEVLGWEHEPTPVMLLPNGGAEQDPRGWWRAVTCAVQRLLARRLAAPERLGAVACTTQWSGTVAVDGAGQPLGNALIWLDSRGAPYARAITRGWPAIEGYGLARLATWLRLSGGVPTHSGKDPIAHILFLKHERPEVYRAARVFLEPKDYLNLCLTGVAAAGPDSIGLHWLTDNRDLRRVDYAPSLLRLAGLDRERLPDLRSPVDVLGPVRPGVAAEWGLPAGLPVVMGTPDMQSAALGSGAVADFDMHLYLGTSSWITCHVPFKKTDLFHNLASLPSAIPSRYFIANEQECAGACLKFLRDSGLAAPAEPPVRFETLLNAQAAAAPAGSGGVIFMPWLNGERTPVDDRDARGGWVNLSLRTTRAEMVRAVYEGVACNTRWLLGALEGFTGRRPAALNVIGGGANSDVWCQIHADVLGRTVRQMQDPILANARGAAFLAAAALGQIDFADIPARVPVARTYAPNPDHRRLYDNLYREYLSLYRALRPSYARLQRGSQ